MNATVINLPITQSGCGNIRFTFAALNALLEFEFREQRQDCIGSVQFKHVLAYRFRNEMHSLGFVEGAYDSIVILRESEWLAELRSIAPAGIGDLDFKKHFAVLLSSNGYFEVVADSCEVLTSRIGLLS